uniref:Putative voltage-dependent sodium channel 1 n=1 Tax=Hirudo verbana TaxID=311461 RepID=A0A2S1WM79_9ANNE|nr:putative voltage-dependent sodium channel 1 [Hirudo verbana]
MEHDKEENEEEKPQKLAFSPASHFQKLTADSISRITRLIEEEKALKQQEEEGEGKKKQTDKDEDEDNTPKPDPALEAGKSLPNKFRNFPKNLYGIPVEDFDPFYNNKYTFVVVGKDQTIFRFSAMKAFFFMNPLHPLRRICLRILTHPFFSLFVMVVILVNCVFMALNKEIPAVEMTFLVIYSIEGLIKMLARGFIMEGFTYLRDPWNWLDFFVVVSAYVTSSFKSLGNASALRTFRVLRTLKTVAVVPGLKTIVGALMEAVKRLRDVMILSLFVLSIFALIGLQLYSGALLKKCIKMPNMTNIQEIFEKDQVFKKEWLNNQSHWLMTADGSTPLLCGGGICPDGYSCYHAGENPDKGFTNFDNFGWAMLCAFRLMTQDLWENLHQQVIRATGRGSVFFFVIVIFFGSFYLVNVILAIVAMAYDDCRKQDILDAEEAEAEQAQWDNVQREDEERLALETLIEAESDQEAGGIREVKSPFQNFISKDAFSENNYGADKISIKSESVVDSTSRTSDWKDKKKSMSLPETPTTSSVVMPSMLNAHMRSSQFSWLKTDPKSTPLQGQTFLLHPCLYNLDLPFADDSTAVTPSSDFLLSQLECHFMTSESGIDNSFNRYNSFLRRRCSPTTKSSSKKISEPTHFHYRKAKSAMNNQVEQMLTDIDRKLSQSDNNSVVPWTKQKHDYFAGNPFVLHSPSASLDMKDVLILKNLLKSASGKKKKGFFTLEKGETKKDFLKRKLFQILFDWECHPTWYRFAHIVELFIMDAFVDLFITICIVINTIFMAVEHADMNFTLETTLRIGNYVFTGIFGVEALLKVMALGLYKYLQDKWSCFDFIIVILSLVELGLSNVKGLSILRSFRLLRVFKLAKSWPTLNLLIGIIGRTLGALGNLCFVLAIIVFIFAVVGMQLFGPNYNNGIFENEEEMRWHFRDFFHSFMIVFRILCGEWIENMWNCIYCTGKICIVFFLLTMIIGNLVVLNLFLALLLSSFGAESLKHSQEDEATNKLQEAIDRINRFVTYIKSHSMYFINVTLRKKTLLNKPDTVISHYELKQSNQSLDVQKGHLIVTISPAHSDYHPDFVEMDGLGQPKLFCEGHGVDDNERSINSWDDDLLASTQSLDRDYKLPYPEYSTHCNHKPNPSHRHHMDHSGSFLSLDHYYSPDEACSFKSDQYKAKIGAEVNVVYVKYPDECCPNKCSPLWRAIHKTYLGRIWWKCRCYSYALVEHSYFETFIIIMILASSLALAVEDRNMEKKSYETFRHILKILDKVFTVIFVFEMALKMTAYGFKRYFTDAWCWLDFIIVDISLVSWGAEGAGKANMGAFRALRTLRALRPLRAVSRWEGMKVVVNALIQAIPSILNVLLVCLVFWLIFSIMGVNLFMGRFGRCLDSDGVVVNDSSLNRTFCDDPSIGHNMTWFNPKITFDNVLIGYLALFQVATFKGWMDIMYAAIDSREAGQQPRFEERYLMYLYFVLFIVFGSFFTMNLFIGVIIEQFNMQKKKMSL